MLLLPTALHHSVIAYAQSFISSMSQGCGFQAYSAKSSGRVQMRLRAPWRTQSHCQHPATPWRQFDAECGLDKTGRPPSPVSGASLLTPASASMQRPQPWQRPEETHSGRSPEPHSSTLILPPHRRFPLLCSKFSTPTPSSCGARQTFCFHPRCIPRAGLGRSATPPNPSLPQAEPQPSLWSRQQAPTPPRLHCLCTSPVN